METEIEESIGEGLGKRDHPDPSAETSMVGEGPSKRDRPDAEMEISTFCEEDFLRSEQIFWDALEAGTWCQPLRKVLEHTEAMAFAAQKRAAEEAEAAADYYPEDDEDEPGWLPRKFRDRWISSWSGAKRHGDFEDTTLIPAMRYTDVPPYDATYGDTLEIFSVKVAGLGEGLQWPLDVFGMVAIRDTIDENRNIIFQRSCLDCQTLTEKDSNLVLTGPSRSVVLRGSVFIEVDLKVKGASEDKTLFNRVLSFRPSGTCYSRVRHLTETSKFSTLEFTMGHIVWSLEATILVRNIDGSWPDGFHGEFAACTINVDRRGDVPDTRSVDHKEIVLLGFGPMKGPVTDDGKIELSRRVVCVEQGFKLEVFVKAWQGEKCIVVDKAGFTTKESGRSYGKLEVASCKMEVTVAWSAVPSGPELRWETIVKNNRCIS